MKFYYPLFKSIGLSIEMYYFAKMCNRDFFSSCPPNDINITKGIKLGIPSLIFAIACKCSRCIFHFVSKSLIRHVFRAIEKFTTCSMHVLFCSFLDPISWRIFFKVTKKLCPRSKSRNFITKIKTRMHLYWNGISMRVHHQ